MANTITLLTNINLRMEYLTLPNTVVYNAISIIYYCKNHAILIFLLS